MVHHGRSTRPVGGMPSLLLSLTTWASLAVLHSAAETVTMPAARTCGTAPADQMKIASTDTEVKAYMATGKPLRTTGVINTYWHVINEGSLLSDGNVSDDHIMTQMAVLNQRFRSIGFTFNLANIDRTTNAEWYKMEPSSEAETQAKTQLRQGTGQDLNIYTISSGGFLGWSAFPWDYKGDPIQDGVVLTYSTLPGVAAGPFALGETATHEVGHWMGLYHTFEPDNGRCSRLGDQVADTAAEKGPSYGCPPDTTDTCPTFGGKDNVQNVMNYVDDACMRFFTTGQKLRMKLMFTVYRAGN